MFIAGGTINAQNAETFYLHIPKSKNDTIVYKRLIQFDKTTNLYHVRDYYPNGQIQMEGNYSSFDKHIKEKSMWCNYRTNTKEGKFITYYKSGQTERVANYTNGLRDGLYEYYYPNGQKETSQNYRNGQKHGACTWWNSDGSIQQNLVFDRGLNLHQKKTKYHYIHSLPKGYNTDTNKKWPLIIYLHGGSSRGVDTMKLYCCGIPDQIWRKRDFKSIVVAPQCPLNQRWSTDNWFENFYEEITTKYRVDASRVYLTGVSLGGSGTWYLAMKYPEKFAAIAPMSGFTRHIDFIIQNIDKLTDIPIWAFHGEKDKIVEFEDTQWLVNQLKDKNANIKFTADPEAGHGLYWSIYPGQELYDWMLMQRKKRK
jgi:pimeloyl-ACP methyl ester carboxylesterase